MHRKYAAKEFGKRLEALLIERGVSKSALASHLNVSRSHISMVANGYRGLSMYMLDKTCQFLNTTPNHLMYGE